MVGWRQRTVGGWSAGRGALTHAHQEKTTVCEHWQLLIDVCHGKCSPRSLMRMKKKFFQSLRVRSTTFSLTEVDLQLPVLTAVDDFLHFGLKNLSKLCHTFSTALIWHYGTHLWSPGWNRSFKGLIFKVLLLFKMSWQTFWKAIFQKRLGKASRHKRGGDRGA